MTSGELSDDKTGGREFHGRVLFENICGELIWMDVAWCGVLQNLIRPGAGPYEMCGQQQTTHVLRMMKCVLRPKIDCVHTLCNYNFVGLFFRIRQFLVN